MNKAIPNTNEFQSREHALVLGGSLAGLLAARVLADHFERVTLIERDRFPGAPAARRGTPQANHVHAMMPRGRQIIEELFPGIHHEMMSDGAPLLDMAKDVAWLTPQGWGLNFDSDIEILAFTRPLLDFHVRRRLADCSNVRILHNTEIFRLLEGTDGRIDGVMVRIATTEGINIETILKADLVVDALGRASRAPDWLEELGYDSPQETVVNAHLGYASRLFEIPAGVTSSWKGLFIQSAPPDEKRGGLLFTVEGDRWLVTLVGGGRDYPPKDEEAFIEFARSLRSPIIYDAIKNANPISPIKVHRGTENRLRNFASLRRQPKNFVVLGDSLCAFNPVYGQGMTIAAMGALTLDAVLREQTSTQANFAKQFHSRMAHVTKAPWMLATGEDYRYRETEGGSPTLMTRFMHAYMDRVVKLSTFDPVVRTLLLRVFGMLEQPSAFFRPNILKRVLKYSLDRKRQPKTRERKSPARKLVYETSLEKRI